MRPSTRRGSATGGAFGVETRAGQVSQAGGIGAVELEQVQRPAVWIDDLTHDQSFVDVDSGRAQGIQPGTKPGGTRSRPACGVW